MRRMLVKEVDTGSFLARLEMAAESFDTEAVHSDADNVLCELLTALGYKDVVEAYHRVDKWFA